MSTQVMPTQAEIAEFQALKQELARAKAENEALKADGAKVATQVLIEGLSFKIGEKGAFSVYGMGRFPVTLYREQWIKLLGGTQAILQALEQNKAVLKTKQVKGE